MNPILNTDSYKLSHFKQYPPKTTHINSYIESRGGRWKRVVFFGLQMFLKQYMNSPISKEMIDEAEEFCTAHGEPFNRRGWEIILKDHNGYIPVIIEAVPEGLVVPTGNVLVQIINSDPRVPWITSYLETALLRAVWYPTSICTQSFMIKNIIYDFLTLTSDDPDGELPFKLHDFGFRGVSSYESGGIGGCSHLVNFLGTDNIAGVLYAKKYYNENMAGFSIPASEHSTITTWGEDNESSAFENMIEQFGGNLYACVSDSYDIWKAVKKWKDLEPKILEKGGTLVIRPDSGNPVAMTSGLCQELMYHFGYKENSKGYMVLPDHIRIIQGDGVNETSIRDILQEFKFRKFSASNIAFGMGGALLQHLDRDTLRFAMKASSAVVDRNEIDVYKNPITDNSKASKKGILDLIEVDGKLITVKRSKKKNPNSYLTPVYINGKIVKEYNFSEIRERSWSK